MISHQQFLFMTLYQLPPLLLGMLIKRLNVWPQVRFFLLLPGTITHELLHWLVAFLTNGQPKGISVWPKRSPDGGWVLGSIGVANFRWYNGIFIGLAPLLGIALILLITPSASAWQFSQRDLYQWLLTAPLWVMCWPSGADWRVGLGSLFGLLMAIALLFLLALLWVYRNHLLPGVMQ